MDKKEIIQLGYDALDALEEAKKALEEMSKDNLFSKFKKVKTNPYSSIKNVKITLEAFQKEIGNKMDLNQFISFADFFKEDLVMDSFVRKEVKNSLNIIDDLINQTNEALDRLEGD